MNAKRCPNCDGGGAYVFHHVPAVPVNSCLLFDDREQARGLEKGDIDLAFCPDCSFIFNAAWKPEATVYSPLYEETQGFSPTYSTYQRRFAEELIDRYDLFGKDVVEIGCGKGDFLALLCELGGNVGVGYDPSFVPARRADSSANVTFRQEFFSEDTNQSPPDLICCRMTLEHILETRRFAQAVRRIASPDRGTVVLFQVPDVRRILKEAAFWDVYYEHCCYFSPRSLDHLFHRAGFDVLRISTDYDDQYVAVEAQLSKSGTAAARPMERDDSQDLTSGVAGYDAAAASCAADWAARIRATAQSGGRTVLWGSGSKAVAFLAAVGLEQHIDYLVDINPYRWGKFVPGTGKQIVGPEFLSTYQPDLVIAMNPIYRQEIQRDLDRHGCANARLYALGEPATAPIAATATTAVDARVFHLTPQAAAD